MATRWLAGGTGVVALLDFAYATLFAVSQGRPWFRPWQTVASAVVGREVAATGGFRTVALGLVLHVIVSLLVVATYSAAASLLPSLRRRPIWLGPLYGAVVYVVMNFAVIPLTRIGAQPFAWSTFTIGAIVLHLTLLGPAAVEFGSRNVSNR
jgi:hypothetical protein